MFKTRKKLDFLIDVISQLPEIANRPSGNYKDFTSRIGYALQLGLKEKEIFFFGLMQWIAIIIACLLWVQILFWIPQPVWESMNACEARGEEDCSAGITIPLMIWGWVCILLAAFPVGILSSAMGTAHFLHKSGQESTVLKCLHVAFSNAWITWSFHYVDGLITVRQIISRFPSKNDHRTPAQIAAEEAAYYAWKVGSAGMLPNIVLGNGLVLSAKNSLKFLKANVGEILKLRMAYSAICWVLGILACIGGGILLAFMGDALYTTAGVHSSGEIYLFFIIPVGIALSVVMVILRPIYILSLCDMYSEYLYKNNAEVPLPSDPSNGKKAAVIFLLLSLAILGVSLLRDEISLTKMLSREYENNPDNFSDSLLETRKGTSIKIGTLKEVKLLEGI